MRFDQQKQLRATQERELTFKCQLGPSVDLLGAVDPVKLTTAITAPFTIVLTVYNDIASSLTWNETNVAVLQETINTKSGAWF